ncbi:FxsA family protein [Nocardiopsis algeriensis]|uniref:UPF0716 protein FxsA n=1 Tax=Nocardiopsis algeriensis TaxID=1478215 RepID=A0A841ISE7_9ACTN|nr:FxsA family protein [Nocardiopsis algeriensis]MBB6121150.1 UPF0716 protein FxsA [Nocardiopsis algeriensis]
MPLLTVLALMALPFVEVGLMIAVGGRIGVPWTLAALIALTVLGVAVLRRAGTKAFRDADLAMRSGRPPRGGLLDPLMLMAGGILLVVPGFLTAAVGLLLVLPFTRPALRWAFTGWVRRRMERMESEFAAQGVTISGQDFGAPRGPRHDEPPTARGRVIQGSFDPVEPDDRT